ncbi:MAG: hypothetical protein DMG65_01890 [Candidatus Angelobacter sp. Gp1-AA117]|nr:MAG: hypothetical protein DMG65_01890 [Candidatus Angelobacter sp. Gp1-AA117]
MAANASSAPVINSRKRRRWLVFLIVVAMLALCGAIFHEAISSHLRAMSVLLRFSDAKATGFGVHFAQHPFSEQTASAQTPFGLLKYRIYRPLDVSNPGGMVLLHGVHHLGLEEPRLVSFARALAGAGVEVMTPELHDLADYHVVPESVEQIGISAVILSTQLHQFKVGIMGLSFAGGMALLAAAKPEYADQIGFVVAIGAHDDLSRVSRFFATNKIEKPDGSTAPFAAHEYGVLVLAYSHLEDFFSPADMPAAREALRLWLWEQPDAAVKEAKAMNPAGQTEFDLLVHHRDQLQRQLLHEIDAHRAEMDAVSPHGHLSALNVPVFLLHGTGDSVIPASETLWLEQDVPHAELKGALISPALVHVSMEQTVSFHDKWALVDFLAHVLNMTDSARHRQFSRGLPIGQAGQDVTIHP